MPFGKPILITATALTLFGCEGPDPSTSERTQPSFSYDAFEPGSAAKAVTSSSKQMLAKDGQVRLALFRKLLSTSGERCGLATEAVLKGNDGKSDFWRVRCTDSGAWLVSVAADSSTRVLSCTALKKIAGDRSCEARWPK